jgi:hypothetical protein
MLRRVMPCASFLLVTVSCGGHPDVALPGACTDALRVLLKDPTAAAEMAVRAGDIRLVAVNGYGRWTPGVQEYGLRKKHGLIVLEETSDTPADQSCDSYQRVATVYAEKYNRKVVELTKANPRVNSGTR